MALPNGAPAHGECQTRLRGHEAARRRSEGAPGMSSPQVLVYGVARTPFGKFYGDLSGYPAAELGAIALNEVMLRSALPASAIDGVLVGIGMIGGAALTVARQAVLRSDLPEEIGRAHV